MFKTTDMYCEDCGRKTILMHDRKEEPYQICTCGAEMKAGFPAPTVMRAGFADGQKRGDRWTYTTQAAKLEQEASRLRKNGKKEEAAEMKAESKVLLDRASTSRDKTDV